MDDPQLDAKRFALVRLAGARRRVGLVRKRVAVGAFSVFSAAWIGVFGQLITGNDPSLGASGSSVQTASASSAAADMTHRRRHPATRLVQVPTGQGYTTVRIPTTSNTSTPSAPAQSATPLVTRQS
jgi:hypothetical protein